ncbi:MAG: hypothetical protein ACLVFD_06325 [Anaerostipes hadrus]
MRTMKRVAAVALSVVVLMTSGVSAKAAVTDVQPAKSSSEAVLKWAKKVEEPFDETSVCKQHQYLKIGWKLCLFSK